MREHPSDTDPALAFFPSQRTLFVLDNVRSALNVGSVFRTADAFAIGGLLLCGITAQPPHRDILKTALGATETVPWFYRSDIGRAMEELHRAQYQIIAIEQTPGSRSLQEFLFLPEQQYAFIFGNEVAGVSEQALSQSHYALEIPQFGAKHSLNISVCAGIVGWEYIRQSLKQV